MGITGPFQTVILVLYDKPSAIVRLPYASSSRFPIRNGTRQGCPLSPLLFALCIEPLAASIRANLDISGVKIHNREFKVSLYADDVLLTLTNPVISLPNLHKVLDEYSIVSGYKINTSKTEALSMNCPPEMLNALTSTYPYSWRNTSLKYLGINLTTSYHSLYAHNFVHCSRKCIYC